MYEYLMAIVVVVILLILRRNVKKLNRLRRLLELQEQQLKAYSSTISPITNALEAMNNRIDHVVASEHANSAVTRLLFIRSGDATEDEMKQISQAYTDKMAELKNG